MSDFERAAVGDLIVLGGIRLAQVIETRVRQGGADGVKVIDGGMYARFVQDWCVHLATPEQIKKLKDWP